MIPLYIVDAFTDRPFAGNPAAVCILARGRPAAWMQQVAMEMNLSETAFLVPDGAEYHLRWFTPLAEVDLCGHATLAAAHTLWSEGLAPQARELRFHTRSGVLAAIRAEDEIGLDFPAEPPLPAELPTVLKDALRVTPTFVGMNRLDYMIDVESETTLRRLTPDFSRLAALPVRGCIVTSTSDDPRFDFVSRYFAPACGIHEDPVTGSAHCCLGPYWAGKLRKIELRARQLSARGGQLRVCLRDHRVMLWGTAVMVLRGQLEGSVSGSQGDAS